MRLGVKKFRAVTWLTLTAFTAIAAGQVGAAAAEERLPWERPVHQSQDAQGYDTARSDYNGGYERDYTAPPPVIRQPRADPYADPYYAPPRRDSASVPYDRDYAPRRFERNTQRSDYNYQRPSRAPYDSRANDLPSYYDQGRDNRDSRQAYYDDRNYRSYERSAPDGSYSMSEIRAAGHKFFGSISKGLASVIEYAFKRSGRPNGYILGEGAGGAFIAGLRYGEGTLYTKNAGRHRVYWQGPTLGYDAGAEGSKTMVLVYNLRRPSDIYKRFGGVDGSAYLVGGVGITFLKRGRVVLAPIKAGVGLRFGANIGYLKYTRRPTWNPF